MIQLKELLNLWIGILSFQVKLYIHEQVVIFNQTLMNIFSDYIPNKLITIDDKDPPWMNKYSKTKIMDKKVACKSFNFDN